MDKIQFKFILSDLDGVIRKFPTERDRTLERKFSLPLGSMLKIAFESTILNKAIRGLIRDEEWRHEIEKSLEKYVEKEIAHLAVKEWSDFQGEVDWDYLKILKNISPNIPVALLTNGTSRLYVDLKKLEINNLFFKVFNSADIGFAKPEVKAFEYVLSVLSCRPQEILFIDDSLSHVNAAEKMGFNVHHYQSLDCFTEYLKIKN